MPTAAPALRDSASASVISQKSVPYLLKYNHFPIHPLLSRYHARSAHPPLLRYESLVNTAPAKSMLHPSFKTICLLYNSIIVEHTTQILQFKEQYD